MTDIEAKVMELTNRTIELAKEHHQVVWVDSGERGGVTDPCFAYTVGLTPELMVLYIEPKMATFILNSLVDQNPGVKFEAGKQYRIGGSFPVTLYQPYQRTLLENPPAIAKHFHQRDDIQVLVVGVPDKLGRPPHDPECSSPYVNQQMWIRRPALPVPEKVADRLRTLADFVELDLPRKPKFLMETFGYPKPDWDIDHPCRSACCLAGMAAFMWAPEAYDIYLDRSLNNQTLDDLEEAKLDPVGILETVVGLPHDLAYALAIPSFNLTCITASMGAAVLRWLASHPNIERLGQMDELSPEYVNILHQLQDQWSTQLALRPRD